MEFDINRENRAEIEHLVRRIRAALDAASRDGAGHRPEALSEQTHESLREMYRRLGRDADAYDLENTARICAYYGMTAAALCGEPNSSQHEHISSYDKAIQQIADLFMSLASMALTLSHRPDLPQIRSRPRDFPALEPEQRGPASEWKELFDATIKLYEQGSWSSAANAARQMAPQILELAAELANRRAGKPLLRSGTGKLLEWIRHHRRSQVKNCSHASVANASCSTPMSTGDRRNAVEEASGPHTGAAAR